MWELALDAFSPVNLVPTLLLLVVLIYWSLVIVGVLSESIGDFDLDLPDAEPGPLWGAVKFLHLGDVPVMVVASLFVVFFWATSMISNYYFNPDLRVWVVLYCLIPNVLISLLITKAILFPLVPWLRRIVREDTIRTDYVGRQAVVHSLEINNEFGQIALEHDGPAIVLNARSFGAIPRHGDVVDIVEYNAVNDTYVVRLSKHMG